MGSVSCVSTYETHEMGETLLKDMIIDGDGLKKGLDEGKTWMAYAWEAISTFLWITIATRAGGSAWAWGLSYVVLNIVCGGSTMHSLCNLRKLLRGDESIVHFALNMFSHILGAIAAHQLAGHLGFATPAVPDHGLSFGEIGSAEWHKFFFGHEFWGIFLFIVFHKKASNESGMPGSLWTILIMAVAFMIAGEASFVFVPARLFSGFSSFADANVWCCFLSQVWSVLVAEVFCDYVWKKNY